jgi:acyl-CoA synthetase (AMP-forming)/AMP-acid ligase II
MDQLLVGDVIRTAAERHPNRPAAALGERIVTYAELARDSEHLTAVLAARGVRRGARIGWWSATSLHAIPLFFAAANLGAIFTPVDPRATPQEAQRVFDLAIPEIVVTDDQHDGDVTITALLAARARSTVEVPAIDERDPHVVFFTSGTTGAPKGVVLTQRTQRIRAGNGAGSVGASICMFPHFHMAGWGRSLSTWLSGDLRVYVERPDAEELLAAVDRHRAIELYCIPAVWERILSVDRSGYDLESLRVADTGTSATPPELLEALADAFPRASTTISYGSTEAGPTCRLFPEELAHKPGSVGRAYPGTSVRLHDGELCVRSPFVFDEYFRDRDATLAAFADGFYRTGDLAERDDEGYYTIVGRVRDVIRTGGETVAPAEVDRVLRRHEAVADAAVAGVPSATWGEVITAFVVLRNGHALDLDALRIHCAAHLAPHKHPRRLVLVDAIPRTRATGQVQRRALIERATQDEMLQEDGVRWGSTNA